MIFVQPSGYHKIIYSDCQYLFIIRKCHLLIGLIDFDVETECLYFCGLTLIQLAEINSFGTALIHSCYGLEMIHFVSTYLETDRIYELKCNQICYKFITPLVKLTLTLIPVSITAAFL